MLQCKWSIQAGLVNHKARLSLAFRFGPYTRYRPPSGVSRISISPPPRPTTTTQTSKRTPRLLTVDITLIVLAIVAVASSQALLQPRAQTWNANNGPTVSARKRHRQTPPPHCASGTSPAETESCKLLAHHHAPISFRSLWPLKCAHQSYCANLIVEVHDAGGGVGGGIGGRRERHKGRLLALLGRVLRRRRQAVRQALPLRRI